MKQGEIMFGEIKDKEERENLKNDMVQIREQGDYETAIVGFQKIVEWDLNNQNDRGALDVLGHTRIAWTNFARLSEDPEEKITRLNEAGLVHEMAKEILKRNFVDDKALCSLIYAHGADLAIERIRLSPELLSTKLLEDTFAEITYAIEHLGGSEAHKAWVYNKSAQLLLSVGDVQSALNAISEGERAIFNGYDEEMKQSDGLMKIRVWETGLLMTYAEICIKQEKLELARLKLEAVLSVGDPTGMLNTRKAQAQKLLNNLSK